MESFQNYIGGKWVPAKSGRTFQNLNPATGEIARRVPGVGRVRTSTRRSTPPSARFRRGG